MTTTEKIKSILTERQIRGIKADLDFACDYFNKQDYNSVNFQPITSLISARSRNNLDLVQKMSWKLYGANEMVLVHEAIKELSK